MEKLKPSAKKKPHSGAYFFSENFNACASARQKQSISFFLCYDAQLKRDDHS
jgi:hypothetical protein